METSTSQVTSDQLSELRDIAKHQAETIENGIWEIINVIKDTSKAIKATHEAIKDTHEAIKDTHEAIKNSNDAVQTSNDSVAILQVLFENNTERLNDLSAKIDELKVASSKPIRSAAAPKKLVHVVADASDEIERGMARSELTFQYKLWNISKLKKRQLSPPCTVRNLPWQIMVEPTSTLTEEGQSQRSLGVFLQCNGESESKTWSCYAVAELRLLSFKKGQKPFSRITKYHYDSKKSVSGFSQFMLWNDVFDPDKGYIEDNAIELEVNIVADAPHGLSYEMERGITRRSEATFRYSVENISELKESQLSPPFIVRNLPWKIKVVPGTLNEEGQSQRLLGVFLNCNGESKSTTWSCYAVAHLRLLSVNEGQKPLSQKIIQKNFYPGNNNWGYTRFILWEDLLNPNKGYIKDDAITLEVHVVADAPYGVN